MGELLRSAFISIYEQPSNPVPRVAAVFMVFLPHFAHLGDHDFIHLHLYTADEHSTVLFLNVVQPGATIDFARCGLLLDDESR